MQGGGGSPSLTETIFLEASREGEIHLELSTF